MNVQLIPSVDIELNCPKKYHNIKCSGGLSIIQNGVKFNPNFVGLINNNQNQYGINLKSSMSYLDFNLLFIFDKNSSFIDGETKINLNLVKEIPMAVGIKFESESHVSNKHNKTKHENNMWLFSEFGYCIHDYEYGFRFDKTLISNGIERKNACVNETSNDGTTYLFYFKNKTNKGDLVVSTRIGKLHKTDCIGDLDIINLNNFKVSFF